MPQLTIQQAFDLAVQHHQAGRLQEAEEMYRQILARQPDLAAAIQGLGVIAFQAGRQEAGIDLIRRALAVQPDFAEGYNNLGTALRTSGAIDQAIVAYRQAIALKPDFADAHYNLANALRDVGQLDVAITAYRQAIFLRPTFAEAYNDLGTALISTGQIDQAIDSYRRAIVLRPDYAEAHNNLGNALKESRKLDEAIAAYQRAIALQPDAAEVHHNLSLVFLLQGNFRQGWEEREWRLKLKDFPSICSSFPQPRWDGSDLNGRTILLHAEQGLGDTIQLIRYAPLVAQRGGKVIFLDDPRLQRLLQSTCGIATWATPDSQIPRFDVYCPLLSLPGVFATTPKSIPAKVPYVLADPKLSESWKKKLAADPAARKVGIVWAGNPRYHNDRTRSAKLAELAPLLRIPGVHFFSLQKGEAAAQAGALPEGAALVDWTNELGDFADTAALIDNLDLVISVDTAVAHLAGAMGKPVWLMLPFVPDWRWLLDRDDTPWYPTMRLFRQPAPGDWTSVIERATAALRTIAAE